MITRRKLFTTFVVILAVGLVLPVFGDQVAVDTISVNIDVNPLALIVASGSAADFTVGGTPAAGDLPEIDDTGNVPTYLQYTSIVPGVGQTTRSVTVTPSAALPAGLRLNIRAGTPTGHGGVGTPVAGGIVIDSTWTVETYTIIDDITSCATGSGVAQGPPVYYTLSIDESTFEDLDTTAATATVVITFTLVGA